MSLCASANHLHASIKTLACDISRVFLHNIISSSLDFQPMVGRHDCTRAHGNNRIVLHNIFPSPLDYSQWAAVILITWYTGSTSLCKWPYANDPFIWRVFNIQNVAIQAWAAHLQLKKSNLLTINWKMVEPMKNKNEREHFKQEDRKAMAQIWGRQN